MAVTLTGSNGLFTRLGAIFKLVERVETHQTDGTSGIEAELQDILDEYSSADLDMVQAIIGQFENIQNSAAQGIYPLLRRAAETTIIEMVHDDNPNIPKDIDSALRELIEQMHTNSDSVDGELTVAPTSLSTDADNTGNPTVWSGVIHKTTIPPVWPDITSISRNQRVRAETIHIVVSNDSQIRGTLGRESYSIRGEPAVTNINDPDWPGGSGISSGGRVVNPSEDAKTGINRQILTNADFEDITSNVPDNWSLDTGVAGTDVVEETSTVWRGNKSLKLVGDGSTNITMRQTLNNSGGTTANIKPFSVYGVHIKVNVSSSPAAGILELRLVDSGGSQIGVGGLKVDLTGLSTGSWLSLTATANSGSVDSAGPGEFLAPASLPDTVKFEIKATTAISAGTNVFIDDAVLFEAANAGASHSPRLALIRGNTDVVKGDQWDITITNNDTGSFQKHFDRFFDFYSKGIQFPFNVSSGETISDSLIS